MSNVIDWICQGDVFIHYLVKRDLLDYQESDLSNLRDKILYQGYGLILKELQDKKTFMWGNGIYSPKYISTHYTLLELCQLGANLKEHNYIEAVKLLIDNMWFKLGKVNAYRHQDICVVAMMVRFACYVGLNDIRINEMIDYILSNQMIDGGYNCAYERKPAPKQSSLHTTVNVLEAFSTYIKMGYIYRSKEIELKASEGIEYILSKRLFRSVRTGEVIHKSMLEFTFPYNWRYDILRALEVMCELKHEYDERMKDAIDTIIDRLDEFGRIKADGKSPGPINIRYTKKNQLCPYNTYRVLKVLKYYSEDLYLKYVEKVM